MEPVAACGANEICMNLPRCYFIQSLFAFFNKSSGRSTLLSYVLQIFSMIMTMLSSLFTI